MTLRTLRLAFAAALAATPLALSAQSYSCADPASIEVRGVSFTGNHAYRSAFLRDGIVSEPTPFARRWFRLGLFGPKRCVDSLEFARDSARIAYLYRRTGYQKVRVAVIRTPAGPRATTVHFEIREGAPIVVDTLRVEGLDSVAERAMVRQGLALQQGGPFDLAAIAKSTDTLQRRLRDNGYPAASVWYSWRTDSAQSRAEVTFAVEPGTRARLGAIDIRVTPLEGKSQQVPEATVRRLLGVSPGVLYRERQLESAKRNLYLTDVYRVVAVDVDSNDVRAPGDSVVAIHVQLAEGLTHSARAGAGWGTLDCVRASGEYHDLNFRGSAWRFEPSARLSKVLIGRPLAGAAGLCYSELRNDPYSANLNYYFGTAFTAPTTLALGLRPTATFYTERRSEFNAFLRTTPIGALLAASRTSTNRRTQTLSYQLEYGRTEAQPAIFCALFNLCLAEDRDPLLANQRLAVAGWSVVQDWSDDPQFPSRGGVGHLELRHASSAIGSDARVQFSKATVDVTQYIGLGGGVVLAPRIRVGAVVGPSFTGTSKYVPSQERLFAGGGNTVRGFSPNDLGPKVYIASAYDTVRAPGATGTIAPTETVYFRTPPGINAERSVPTGGSALVVANLELRVPSPWLPDRLKWSLFADAGELWNPGAGQAEERFRGLKLTPGVGVRIDTPVGAIRIDVAYNPYSPRPGPAFFDTPISAGGQLYCVSPGNTLAVTGINSSRPPVQVAGTCARDFQPPSVSGFRHHLTLSFGIGQAY